MSASFPPAFAPAFLVAVPPPPETGGVRQAAAVGAGIADGAAGIRFSALVHTPTISGACNFKNGVKTRVGLDLVFLAGYRISGWIISNTAGNPAQPLCKSTSHRMFLVPCLILA